MDSWNAKSSGLCLPSLACWPTLSCRSGGRSRQRFPSLLRVGGSRIGVIGSEAGLMVVPGEACLFSVIVVVASIDQGQESSYATYGAIWRDREPGIREWVMGIINVSTNPGIQIRLH